MKFAFFGTPDIASRTLESLYQNLFVPEIVISNPDAPVGRKQVVTPSPVKEFALSNNIPVITPQKLDDGAIKEIQSHQCDFAIVVAYGKILPTDLIESFPKGVLNIHYSLLPKYRGASPVESALLNNDKKTGVTIQKMVPELDAGDIIALSEIDIELEDTTLTLRDRLIDLGSELLIETLPSYLEGMITPTEQDPSEATFTHKLKKADGEISLSDSDIENWNKYRAYAAWPGVFFFHNGKRIKIKEAEFIDGEFVIKRIVPEGKKEQDYNPGQFAAGR